MENSFERLLVGLVDARVDFITVGGIALALNGHVRATEDVDILVRRTTENVERLLEVLGNFGQGYARELTSADFTDEEGAIRVIEDFPIDIFTRMGGRTYEDLLPHVRLHIAEQHTIPYLDAAGLVLLKADSLRPKDKQDVIALRGLLNKRKR